MSRKFWVFRTTNAFSAKQLPGGGRNEIAWAAVGTFTLIKHAQLCSCIE